MYKILQLFTNIFTSIKVIITHMNRHKAINNAKLIKTVHCSGSNEITSTCTDGFQVLFFHSLKLCMTVWPTCGGHLNQGILKWEVSLYH